MLKRICLLLSLGCLLGVNLLAQGSSVSGTVSDAQTDELLLGVAILEQGTSNGTITDLDGNYTLALTDENAVLVFSYLGYVTQEISVAGQKQLDIALEEDVANLDEVVVVGYGVQKKKEVTGAITKVNASDLEDKQLGRVEDALKGRTSGVRVTANSGQPGAASEVRVRGVTTINDNNPLYVVDGVIIAGGIEYLNQNDIESIEVLKDAASAAIYGTRAAAGVILVTTKNGRNKPFEVRYEGYYGSQYPWKKLNLLNANEYAILSNEAAAAAGQELPFSNPDQYGEGTDWQDLIFNKGAPIQSHNLSFSNSTETSSYFMSFGYFDQSGIVSDAQSRFQRANIRFNFTQDIGKFLKFGSNIAYTRTTGRSVAENTEFGSPLIRAINLDPITPLIETDSSVLAETRYANNKELLVRDENDGIYGISPYVTSEILNPVAALQVLQQEGGADKVVGNFFAEVEPIKNVRFRSSIGADLAFWKNKGFTPVHYLNAANNATVNSFNSNKGNGLNWIWDNTLSYSPTFGKHRISAMIGTSANKNEGEQVGGTINDLPVNDIEDASLTYSNADNIIGFGGFEYLTTLISYLGRVTYNYNSKYLFSALYRIDGSPRFGSNNRFGHFPSLSLGWVVTEEPFMNIGGINFLKIRASWGINGSDRIRDFGYISTIGGARNYTFGIDEDLVQGRSPNQIENPDLRWEETTQINLGFDAKIFRNISLTFDWFQKSTDGMLLDLVVPGYVGNLGPIGNIAEMENTGIELELGYLKSFGPWKLNLGGNVSYIQNEIVFLGFDKEELGGQTFGPQALQITETSLGESFGYLYGYQTDGVFQNQSEVNAHSNAEGVLLQPNAQAGDFRFVDIDGNGELNADDRTNLGNSIPNWTYGFSIGLDWRNFDFNLFGQGVAGNKIFKAIHRFDLPFANRTTEALERWTGEGSTNEYPRLIVDDPNGNFSRSSDFFVEDGDFVRIKNLQIGYTLPRFFDYMKKIRLYVSANNILTLTKYSGFDPEIVGGVDRGIYPQAKSFIFGVNATF